MSIDKQNETTESIPLAQNDPLRLKNDRLNMPLVVITLLLGLICIVAGILTYNSSSLSITFIFLPIGALLLFMTLILLWARVYTRNNLRRKQQQREIAVQQPEQFMLPTQPTPTQELPQPGNIKTGVNLGLAILFTDSLLAIFWFIFDEVVNPSWSLSGIVAHVLIALLYGLIIGTMTSLVSALMGKQAIEVSESGITTSTIGAKKNYIAWQDVRLFATSANSSTPSANAKKHPSYELASTQTVVRWLWQHPPIKQALKTEPRMSRDEYDRWMEHLHGYIVARTNLPLLNLDTVKLEKGTQMNQASISSATTEVK